MDIISYRVVKEKYLDFVFDGEGARLYGGRWNSKGVPVVYT
ncbi:MAG: RES domain-containing protein, partial [Proteobacteria bacterium]|nr:RES domain-containing protein [Pseudomonadota bacterium]